MTLKGPYADDYPSRETALAIIEAMKNPAYRWRDVEKATGLDNALYTADRCWMVYGYPELEPGTVARWVAERSMGGSPSFTRPTPTLTRSQDTAGPAPSDHSYGFTPRR